jgi:type IV secretory pathway VirD2 relaxase
MAGDDQFKPRLGRARDGGQNVSKRFSKRIYKVAARLSKAKTSSAFTGARIGRGTVAGRMAQYTINGRAAHRLRRVTVKVHIARLTKGGGRGSFSAHVSYLKRDGVDRSRGEGELYTARDEGIDGRDFIERSQSDRHQFRIIISAEEGDQLEDLKTTTRQLMSRMQADLGVKLDWVAADHHNTGYPHTHIVIRGKDHFGRDLVIAKDYLTYGLRSRAQDIVTGELGARRDLDIIRSRMSQIEQDRFTLIDRNIIDKSKDGVISLSSDHQKPTRLERALISRRLRHLETLQLAQKITGTCWRLKPETERVLKRMGRDGDIIKMLASSHEHIKPDRIHAFAERVDDRSSLIGEVIGSGAEDELRDRRFLLVRSFDERVWYIDAGAIEPGTLAPDGAIVVINKRGQGPRPVDRTISNIAARGGGVYSDTLHAQADGKSSTAYRLAHKRRLEALRRSGLVERGKEGIWTIPSDYLKRAAAFDTLQHGSAEITVKSWVPLEQQVSHEGATWLDVRQSEGNLPRSVRLDTLQSARSEMLRKRGILDISQNALTETQLESLRSKEMAKTLSRLSSALGQQAKDVKQGLVFEGTFGKAIDLAEGRYAILANGKEFALVPWRPEMEKQRGMDLRATVSRNGLSWTFESGLKRGLTR